jgi:hypothetical protein
VHYEIKWNIIEKNWDIVAGRKEILKGIADRKFAEKAAEELIKAYNQGSADRENIDKKIDEAIKDIFF